MFVFNQVGKTNITQRFAKDKFTEEYKKTLGVDFLTKKRYVQKIDKEIEFMIWDTAGQEYFDAITRKYYKGAAGCLLVFSTTDKASLEAMPKWHKKVQDECGKIPMLLVQNKIDLLEESVINDKDISIITKQLNINLLKVSAKDNLSVPDLFDFLAIEFFSKGLQYKQTKTLMGVGDVDKNFEPDLAKKPVQLKNTVHRIKLDDKKKNKECC